MDLDLSAGDLAFRERVRAFLVQICQKISLRVSASHLQFAVLSDLLDGGQKFSRIKAGSAIFGLRILAALVGM